MPPEKSQWTSQFEKAMSYNAYCELNAALINDYWTEKMASGWLLRDGIVVKACLFLLCLANISRKLQLNGQKLAQSDNTGMREWQHLD